MRDKKYYIALDDFERRVVVNCLIDAVQRIVLLDGNPVSLPAKEYDLLLFLVRNRNTALYREAIYEQVWQDPYVGNTRTIDLWEYASRGGAPGLPLMIYRVSKDPFSERTYPQPGLGCHW